MEGKVGTDPRRLAYEQYMNSKDKARYTSLAQKLAQHINHLAEDKNTRIRWIWELIQNAKDVPNEFGKCRIRIEIKDDKFIFAHNGDPFRVSDLQSLVAQYSSKAEQNKLSTQTTGKYGTGFIVTYILSKKIRIKGLLSMKTKEEIQSTKKQESQDDDKIQLSSEEQISSAKSRIVKKQYISSPNEQQQSFQENVNIEEDVQKMMPKKSKLRNFEGGSLYQRFDIFLDREYKDRDKELFFKLMMTQRNLMEDLLKIEPEPKWQRKQSELNTQFIYEDIDQAANKMITESMACLKELFPYALLFNPKLFQIQVIDKRTHKSVKKFGIKRLPEESFNGLKIFNANILEEGCQKPKKFSLAYMDDEDTYSTIAIPLQINQDSIKLLEMNNKFPKMFKEFPLIGCKDTGFNFAFTSKRFYPNQTRSNLLLQQIQGRDSKKTRANWQSLTQIFEKGLQLYRSVAKIIDSGQENLFIVSMDNQFTQPVFKNKKMHEIYKKYQQEIIQMDCIQFRNKSIGTIDKLVFPFGKSQNKKIDDQKYCSAFNSVFAIVLGQENTLSDQNYKRFYPKFQAYYPTWSQFTRFPDVMGCVSQLSQLRFVQLVFKVKGNRQDALNILDKIYEFLLQNHPSYLIKDKQKNPNKKALTKFILTNNEEFKDINEQLAIKKDLPSAYQEIGQNLGIHINQITIFDKFAKYFTTVPIFGVPQMLSRFESFFFPFISSNTSQSLLLLGRFLTTFNIKTEAIEIATKLKILQKVDKAFEIKDKNSKLILENKMKNQFRVLFEVKLLYFINNLMRESQNLNKFILLTQFQPSQNSKAIEWLNSVFKFQEALMKQSKNPEFSKAYMAVTSQRNIPTSILWTNLSLSLKFVSMQKLKCFSFLKDQKYFKGNYPDKKDIEMYQRAKDIEARRKNRQNLGSLFGNSEPKRTQFQSKFLHESINYKLPKATTFKQQFKFIIDVYHYYNHDQPHASTTHAEKTSILNYIYHLRESATKNRELQFKMHAFRELEQIAYHQYPNLNKTCVQKFENKVFAFSLVKNEQEITAAREIVEEFGSMKKALQELKALKAKNSQETKK